MPAQPPPPTPYDPDDPVPTKAERKFIKLYLETGNVARAALEAKIYKPRKGDKGYRPHAVLAGSKVLRKYRPHIEQIMDQEGLSLVTLIRDHLAAGLESTQVFQIGRGENRELEKVPDFRARQKYLEMAFKLRGSFPTTPAVVKVQGGDPGAPPIAHQHYESIAGLPPEEKKKRLDEMIAAARKGPVRVNK